MKTTSHIVVTPKGLELQNELLRETLSDFPSLISPKPKTTHSTPKSPNPFAKDTAVPTYFMPARPGYFGPKGASFTADTQSPNTSTFFPNYLKRDPREYPPKHLCHWRPKSITEKSQKIEKLAPKGKYAHHTLFTDTANKFAKGPCVNDLNDAVYGKEYPLPINLATGDFKSWGEISNKGNFRDIDDNMTASRASSTQTNFHQSAKLGSTGFSKFRRTMNDWQGKEERVMSKHMENQRNYEKLLFRFDEETRKKLNKYQENQHEGPEFENKMKQERQTLEEMVGRRQNEEERFARRLNVFQKKHYEPVWKVAEDIHNKYSLVSPSRRGKKDNIKLEKPEEDSNKPTARRGGPWYDTERVLEHKKTNKGTARGNLFKKVNAEPEDKTTEKTKETLENQEKRSEVGTLEIKDKQKTDISKHVF